MIGKNISHYKILDKLGEGGMGEVYLAEDTKLNRQVALKFLPMQYASDKELKIRFKREAQAAAALNHPNIITIHEVSEHEGKPFIAMEYVEGESLKNLISKKDISINEVLDISLQISGGLAVAHKAGIVHRDIKPQNILVGKDHRVRICDFGLVKLKTDITLTQTGSTLGTLAYMSPEQAQGKEIDQRSDIFSLGVILYEMIASRLPFQGDHEAAVIHSILNDMPEPLARYKSNLPEGLQRIVDKAMEKNREMRYQHAEDLRVDLRKLKMELETGVTQTLEASTKLTSSIAVLPFADLSANKDQQYFCDGMAEEIINALTHVEGLRVVARTSAFSFRGKEVDIREIGKKLNVRALLEGSVRKAGNRLRISAQLINVADGYHLWSEKYDRDMENVFAIQDEISLAIVDKLKIKLLGEEKAKILRRYTDNLEAYNLYLKGRFYWNTRTEGGLKISLDYFQKAIEKDPEFAVAYSGLADSYSTLGFYDFLPKKDAFTKARSEALKALEIDEGVGEAHVSLAGIKAWYDWDWAGAEREFKRALELGPSNVEAHHMYAHLLEGIARFNEAFTEMRRALELEPLSINLNSCMGQILFIARRYDEAMHELQKTIEMDPSFSLPYYWLGRVYLEKAMHEEAIEQLEKGTTSAGIRTMMMGALGYAYAVTGRTTDAQNIVDQLKSLSKKRYVDPYFEALVYVGLGKKERAFELLEKAYEGRSAYISLLKVDPLFDNLHSDQRYISLLKKMGLEK
jgi:serine/threonine protein kinase